jgi:hypothetical protein
VRLKVRNSGTRADNVQVYAAKLAKIGSDGKFHDIPSFSSLNMVWLNYQEILLDGLTPKMEAGCDVIMLVDPSCELIERLRGCYRTRLWAKSGWKRPRRNVS